MFERLYQESLIEIYALRQRVIELEAKLTALTTEKLEPCEEAPSSYPHSDQKGHHACNGCTGC